MAFKSDQISNIKESHCTRKKVNNFFGGKEVWWALFFFTILASLLSPNFFTKFNITNLLTQSSIYGTLAIGQFLVILSGGYDLSVAAILALSSCIIAKYAPVNIYLFIFIGIFVGMLIGLINGLTITYGKVPAMIATLATAGIARGLAFNTTSHAISVDHPIIKKLNSSVWIFSWSTIIWIVLVVLFSLFLNFTKTGTYIYAVGGNEDTARLAGIRTKYIKCLVYIMSGFVSGIGGFLYVIRSTSGVPHIGTGWELDTIASVIIGGTKLNGGVGNLPSAMAGVLIYMLIRNALNIIALDPYYQDIIKAFIILIAVGGSLIRSRKNRGTNE